ncbi:phage tail tape measure protein [Pseudomonas sp. 21]|uniref:phage tail tape measure protein n=1 Tax=Pseudomonas sp. 21 TaxID=1619948 RepID=UPI000AB38893|nr:phage tail tape measure protein [Pseudomonas sp. 21]
MADVNLRLGVDADSGVRQLGRFGKSFADVVKQLQQPVSRINTFSQLQTDLQGTEKALGSTRTRLRDMQQELVSLDSANAQTSSNFNKLAAAVRTMESNARRLDQLQYGQRAVAAARDRVRELGNELAGTADPSKQMQEQYRATVEEFQRLQRSVSREQLKLGAVSINPGELTAAKTQLAQLSGEMQRGQAASRALQTNYRQVGQELGGLEKTAGNQRAELARLGTQLRSAGVDTRNLSGEQARLRQQMAQQLPQIALQNGVASARDALGVRPFTDINAEVVRLQRNYALLRSSGQATGAELAQAYGRLVERTRELQLQTNGWRDSLGKVKNELIAGAAAFGGVALVGQRSFGQYAAYEQQIAGIAAITDLAGDRLRTMSGDVRQLSLDMGKPAAQSAAALRDLLGSGVDTDHAMTALALSTKAAVAGMSDTKTAASVGLSIINAYGEGVDQLGGRYDQLFLAIQDGVVEFDELAAGLGQVLPSAAAAGVSFSEVGAAIARMTVQGIKAPIAITALRSAINQLAAPAPEAAKRMEELGIRWNGLAGTLQQIAQKKLGFEAMREIIPDTEGRTAILALTNQIDAFVDQVERMDEAAGATERAYGIMKDTPQAQVERFQAALNDLQLSFGQAVANGLPLVNLLVELLNAFNGLPEGVRVSLVTIVAFGVAGKALGVVLSAIRGPFSLFLAHLSSTPAAAAAAGASLPGLAGRFSQLGAAIGKINLGAALRFGGYGIIASQLYELYQIHQELKSLEKDQEDYARSLEETLTKFQPYRNEMVLTSAEVAKLSETERASYLERLRGAETYYQKLSEQISRADFAKNGPTAAVSPEAMDAYRESRQYAKAREAIEQELKAREVAESAHQLRLDTIRRTELSKVKDQLAKQLEAYDAANKRLEGARKEREKILQRFSDLVSSFQGGAQQQGNTFGDLMTAKSSARNALQAGDTGTALKEAQRAAGILEALRDAGENTYGFEGIARELQQVADAASQINVDSAQASFEAEKQKAEQLIQYANALKRITIGYQSDEESEEQTRQRLVALAQEWAKYMQIPVTLVTTGDANGKRAEDLLGGDSAGSLPQYATGGVLRGPGTGTSDSILARLSNGEGILTARAVRHYGPDVVHALNGLRLPRFAEGGVAMIGALPALTGADNSGSGVGASSPPLAPVYLTIDGRQYGLLAEEDVARQLHRTSLKSGHRRSKN